MKTKLILIFSLVFSLSVHAQDNYMALCFGRGQALGDFAKTEDILNNGFAKGGFATSYSGAYFPYGKLGLGGTLGFNTNYLKREETQKNLIDLVPSEFLPILYTDNSEFGYWRLVFIHVGPQFTWPIGKLYLDVFLFGGIDLIFLPVMRTVIRDNSDPENVYSTFLSTKNASMGFDGGVALRYQLNNVTDIKIYTNYVHSSAKGSLYWNYTSMRIQNMKDFKTKIQILNIGIGLTYRI